MVLGAAGKVRRAEEREDKIHQEQQNRPGHPPPLQQSWALFSCSDFPSPGTKLLLLQVARAQIFSMQLQPGTLRPQGALLHPKTSQMDALSLSNCVWLTPVILGFKVTPRVSSRCFSRIFRLFPSFPASWCVLILSLTLPVHGTAGGV